MFESEEVSVMEAWDFILLAFFIGCIVAGCALVISARRYHGRLYQEARLAAWQYGALCGAQAIRIDPQIRSNEELLNAATEVKMLVEARTK